ncbi:hypothetical protein [Paraburkholderia bannensis]|uniref:hypothetical protein n=1 Tax=Paraburkholderia bannensis TaxID=765414 RepID=UPI002AB6B452|nr:hypothetical protein [Paraburkholderia bannensis]
MNRKMMDKFEKFAGFRCAVDAALGEEVASEVAAAVTGTKDLSALQDEFRQTMALLSDERKTSRVELVLDELADIGREIAYAHLLASHEFEPYLTIAKILRFLVNTHTAQRLPPLTDEVWSAFFWRADQCRAHWTSSDAGTDAIDARHVTFVQAVRFFRSRNIALIFDGTDVHTESASAQALSATLSMPLSGMGDTFAMNLMDQVLATRLESTKGRFRFHPVAGMTGKHARILPCGLLYRYALKTLGAKRASTGRRNLDTEIGAVATHMAALHDVEPFSTFEMIPMQRTTRVMDVLRQITTFDELFSVPQCRPEAAERLIDVFASAQAGRPESGSKWSVADAKVLWSLLSTNRGDLFRSTFVDAVAFQGALARGVGPSACSALLDAFVVDRPNRQYRFPADAHLADTRECAIARASGGRYWIAPLPILGPAFLGRLVGQLASQDPLLSARVGTAFEDHMVARLTELGFTVTRGNLKGRAKGQRAGDADLIIATQEVVALFELKKKGLRRRTVSGDHFLLASDLAQGVVHAVNQLSRHELTLMRTGRLEFEDGRVLQLNGRSVVKGVISLADYGGLHDVATLNNALKQFASGQLDERAANTREQRKALDSANGEFKTLGELSAEFDRLPPKGRPRNLFGNLVFRNVYFIEELLIKARTAEQFLEELAAGARISSGTRDPFFDRAYLEQ